MKLKDITKFAFKNTFRRKGVAILAITGVAVAITLQITMASISTGIDDSFSDVFNDLIGDVELSQSNTSIPQLPTDIVTVIEQSSYMEDISYMSPQIELPSSLMNGYLSDGSIITEQGQSAFSITGIEMDSFRDLSEDLDTLTIDSSYLNNDYEAVISYTTILLPLRITGLCLINN